MGRNSVIPCTTASTMICSIGIDSLGPRDGRLFGARAGSIPRRNSARFFSRAIAAERVDGDAPALSALPLFPLDSPCARRVRRRSDARRGAALGMAAGLPRAEPGRGAPGADHRRATARSPAPMPSPNISTRPRAATARRPEASGCFPARPVARAEARRLVDWFHRKFHDEVTAYLVEEKVYRRYGPQRRLAQYRGDARRATRTCAIISPISAISPRRGPGLPARRRASPISPRRRISRRSIISARCPGKTTSRSKSWYALLKSRPSFRPLLADRVAGFIPSGTYADLDF